MGAEAVRRVCPVIAGPTAVGKTALVVELAARFPIEIVSLDSRQIYHGLRLGTAQPDATELAACPHHLVDFLPPTERYSARRFRDDFQRVAAGIRERGRCPVLVGGAGLYLTALREGLFALPADPDALAAVRRELDALPDDEIRDRLHAEDPASWTRIHARDRYRSQRALEIRRLAGEPMSDLMADRRPDPALGWDYPLVVLDRERDDLRARIARRLQAMLEAGWLAETSALLARHGPDCPGLRTLGYRELSAHLAGETDLPTALAQVSLRTGQYAKRQQTWFRAQPQLRSGAPDDPTLREALSRLLERSCATR
ncbi:MAG: tRNA (adenosine(37)-N6)-dimethylallyltransferase MiaA [Gemmatimonas sp.]|nr:tRNA (adenosine(37)-N6)-dimethylallyltransferase MiaA [Gemmatimonas sp.]